MNKKRKVVITITYNEMGIIIDTKAEELDLSAKPEQPKTGGDIWDRLSEVYNMDSVPEEAKSIIGDVMIEVTEQPEQRWIPVTERMPDEEDWYIFSTDKLAWVAFWNGIEWSGGVAGAVLKDIIAWKPFPAPYRKGDAE